MLLSITLQLKIINFDFFIETLIFKKNLFYSILLFILEKIEFLFNVCDNCFVIFGIIQRIITLEISKSPNYMIQELAN